MVVRICQMWSIPPTVFGCHEVVTGQLFHTGDSDPWQIQLCFTHALVSDKRQLLNVV